MKKLMQSKFYLLLIFYFGCYKQTFSQPVSDVMAEIGNKAAAVRTHLLHSPARKLLPDIQLPLSSGTSAFLPMNKLDSEHELNDSLVSMRSKYAVYLSDSAPAIGPVRKFIQLDSFDWRRELALDKEDFSNVLNGSGQWENVLIPHFGPPLGKEVAYYRKEFTIPDELLEAGSLFLKFKAVDYKAHIFFNNYYIGSHEGAFSSFEFNVYDHARRGVNVLVVKVENDYPMMGHIGEDGRKFNGDKIYAATGMGYNDPQLGWHHNPPGMGIYQGVFLESRSTVHIRDIFVRPLADTDSAEVWIEINNTKLSSESVLIRHSLFGKNFSKEVYKNALYIPQTIKVPGFHDLSKPSDWSIGQLKMQNGINYLKFKIVIPAAKRWNPDSPWLYQIQIALLTKDSLISDMSAQCFGMRSFRMDTISNPKGGMYLNNSFIRLRGANTMGSFMRTVFDNNIKQLIDDILLAKIAGINYIRMTQFPVQKEVYDFCDKLGMMIQSDLPLFGVIRRNQVSECIRQTEELIRHVRSHPSNILVSYINERFPNADGEPHRHLNLPEEFDKFFTAADQIVLLNNPDQVIKPGDGDYDPPSPGLPDYHVYNGWYNGHGLGLGEMYQGQWLPVKPGWFYACGEFGSEGLDNYETMKQYYPSHWLPDTKSAEKEWTPASIAMSQTYRFYPMWFSRQFSVKDWIDASQLHQARITRLTTEAFRRNNNMISFAIHLFIDAWPAGWMKSIMDVKRKPKQAYFEYAHALKPLATSLRADRQQVFSGSKISVEAWISNDMHQVANKSIIRYQWEKNGKVFSSGNQNAHILADSSCFQGYISLRAPKVSARTVLVLRFQLLDSLLTPIHESVMPIVVHPVQPFVHKRIWVAGRQHGPGLTIVKDQGWSLVSDATMADVLIIDSIPVYTANRKLIDSLVANGKSAVFLEPMAGVYHIAGDTVTVSNTNMGKYYFASPAISHPKMRNYFPDDFWFWYDWSAGCVAPFLGEMSQMNGWDALLTTGQTSWTGSMDYAYAAAEKKFKKGYYRICNLQLANKLKENPVAIRFINLLVE